MGASWRTAAGWTVLYAAVAASLVPSVVNVVTGDWGSAADVAGQAALTGAATLMGRREHARHAVLLLLAAATIGMSNLGSTAFEDIGGYWVSIGWYSQWLPAALLAPVLLAYPAGRLDVPRHRWLMFVVWLWAAGLRLLRGLTWDPAFGGYHGPVEWITLHASRTVSEAATNAGYAVVLAVVPWFAWECLLRWRRARGPAAVSVRWISAIGVVLGMGLAARQALELTTVRGWTPRRLGDMATVAHNSLVACSVLALLALAVRAAARRGAVVERLLLSSGEPEVVQRVLREELHDPSASLSFALDEGWVDASGHSMPVVPALLDGRDESEGTGTRLRRALVCQDGQAKVEIDLATESAGDPALLRTALAAASLVLENGRLALEREAHLTDLSASRARIVESGVAQRRQLERDLHDGAQQHLLALSATLSRARLASERGGVTEALDTARDQLASAMGDLRRLARGIHPAALSQGGLEGGLAALAALVPDVELTLHGPVAHGERLDPSVEATAYFVAAEAVTNARKHAGPGPVLVELTQEGDVLTARVADSGPGGATLRRGGGLSGLDDRLRALGGSLTVESGPTGTTITARLPLTSGPSR